MLSWLKIFSCPSRNIINKSLKRAHATFPLCCTIIVAFRNIMYGCQKQGHIIQQILQHLHGGATPLGLFTYKFIFPTLEEEKLFWYSVRILIYSYYQMHYCEWKITEERGPCLQIEHHYLHSAACLHQHQELLVVQEGISTEAKIGMHKSYPPFFNTERAKMFQHKQLQMNSSSAKGQ